MMSKLENNKIELEESLEEENLDLEETYKEKALRLVKKPIFYIPALVVTLIVVGYFAQPKITDLVTANLITPYNSSTAFMDSLSSIRKALFVVVEEDKLDS